MSARARNRARYEMRATRILARAASDAGAIDATTFEFLCEEPSRADESPEFSAWLAGAVCDSDITAAARLAYATTTVGRALDAARETAAELARRPGRWSDSDLAWTSGVSS